jgi:hypothetical protein
MIRDDRAAPGRGGWRTRVAAAVGGTRREHGSMGASRGPAHARRVGGRRGRGVWESSLIGPRILSERGNASAKVSFFKNSFPSPRAPPRALGSTAPNTPPSPPLRTHCKLPGFAVSPEPPHGSSSLLEPARGREREKPATVHPPMPRARCFPKRSGRGFFGKPEVPTGRGVPTGLTKISAKERAPFSSGGDFTYRGTSVGSAFACPPTLSQPRPPAAFRRPAGPARPVPSTVRAG